MPTESHHVARLLQKLRQMPGTWWTRIEQRNIRGTPDIIGCVKCVQCGCAKFVGIEAKTERGKPSPLQEEVRRQLESVGAYARIARLPREATELLEELTDLREKKL
jgi:hypothetical protein